MQDERRTCPECNFVIVNNKCTNRDYCTYKGPGWTKKQREEAWANVGEEYRTIGSVF